MNEHSDLGEPAPSETVDPQTETGNGPELDPTTTHYSVESPVIPGPEAPNPEPLEAPEPLEPLEQPKLAVAEDPDGESIPTEAPEPPDPGKKPRATRVPKAQAKPAEAGSVTAIVERVVRLSSLDEAHVAALARLLNISLPEEHVARLTRLTAISLGPVGTSAAEALTIVLGLESANLIHVGVQLGRLTPATLPDVYRCAHAITGSSAPTLPKGDPAVFAVADVLATLSADDFTLARSLQESLQ